MTTNAAPWENLRFSLDCVEEVKRKFFGTLYNTYSFFALYANLDNFNFSQNEIPITERPEIDRWIISLLNTLKKEVAEYLDNYEPTRAGRAIHNFVNDNLSNWYVRLNRKRFWNGELNNDKISAYQTLYTCLETIAILISPIAPFYGEQLFCDLNEVTKRHNVKSVHVTKYPKPEEIYIDKELEQKMELAQQVSSMCLALRRKENLKVRQPLSRIIIPVLNQDIADKINDMQNIILSEINVKKIEFLTDTTGIIVKKIKPDFKKLGKKLGKLMKLVSVQLENFNQQDISKIETTGKYTLNVEGTEIEILIDEVEIISEDIPGWTIATDGQITVALDITVTEELRQEGIAREFVNRIQNIRKDSNFEVTDKIFVEIQCHPKINEAIKNFNSYISSHTLALEILLIEKLEADQENVKLVEIDEELTTHIKIYRK